MRHRSSLMLSTAIGVLIVSAAQAQTTPAVELDTVVVEGDGASGISASEAAGTGAVDGYVARATTTGSKTATPIAELPQSVSVIGREEFEDRGAQKVDEALRYTAGVFTQPFGYDSDTDWFYIRGFDATQTGVYLDGLNLYQYAFAGYSIDPFLLERVEVLRGPASVLYGGSNPGGIINEVSKRPTGERLRYIEGSLTDDPNGAFAFDMGDKVGGPDSPWSVRVLGKIKGGETQTDYADNFRGMIAPMVAFEPDATTRLDLYGFFQYDNLRHTNGFFPYEGTVVDAPFGRIPRSLFYGEPDVDRFMSRQALVGYEFETEARDGVTLRSKTRYGRTEREEYGPYTYGFYDPATQTGFLSAPVDANSILGRLNFAHDTHADTLTTDNSATFEFATGGVDHTLLTGIDYKYYRIDQVQASGSASPLDPIRPVYGVPLPALFSPYIDETITLNQLGFYAQEQAKFGDGFILTLNGRYDRAWVDRDDRLAADADYDGNEGALSGRAGLAYEFENGLVPYVSVATFFNPQIGSALDGRPVENQTGEQYEAGVKYSPTFFPGTFTASVFDLTRRNVVQTDPLTFLPVPVGEVRSRGVELEAKADITDNWKVTGAFTALDLEITDDIDTALIGNQPFLIPEITASAWADYTVIGGSLDGLSAGAGLRYVGESYADNQNTLTVPDALVMDAAIRYERDDRGVSLNVNNLFDKRYVTGCQGALTCSYGQGREFVVKAHMNW
ncbi:TonB-dependent siderophore receptor [Aureimonas sp. ME7]|uniref:TonB-dependent siderophore receptor n=1 Tax=Aureimonas sp. ME7 TaxID=2744252 RepID=UPI001FCE5F50|nr:TonB-dependent siderophore receptor [Aureimonas sp. ME7]